MSRMSRRLWAALLISGGLALAEPGWAEAPPEVTSEVRSVASLGRWFDASGSGHYRVILAAGGAEVPVTRIWVQWMEEAMDGTQAVRASAEVDAVSAVAGATVRRPAWRALGRNRLEVTASLRTPDGRWRRLRQIATIPGHIGDR